MKKIYLLTNKNFLIEVLNNIFKLAKIIHISNINQCPIKVDILIVDNIDKESLDISDELDNYILEKNICVQYLIHIGQKIDEYFLKVLFQKEFLFLKPIEILNLEKTLSIVAKNNSKFLMIDYKYIYDSQNSSLIYLADLFLPNQDNFYRLRKTKIQFNLSTSNIRLLDKIKNFKFSRDSQVEITHTKTFNYANRIIQIKLTDKENQIFSCMLDSPNFIIDKVNLVSIIYETENYSSLEAHVYKLRSKLGNLFLINEDVYELNIGSVL